MNIQGKNNIPSTPYILVSNHQSPWETIFLYYYFAPITAILKKQLFLIPFFGWALRMLKPIAIDRNKKREARITILTEGKARIKDGISILIFPEGTRVKQGQYKKFTTSGASLAIESGVVLLPVAHNAGKFWPTHSFIKHPGTIDVVIGKALPTSGADPRELSAKAQTWINNIL